MGWQWRNFVPYLCQLVFAAILWVKLWEMFVTVISLKYALFVSQWSYYGHFLNQLIHLFYLNSTLNFRHLTPHVTPCYTHKMAFDPCRLSYRPISYDVIQSRRICFVHICWSESRSDWFDTFVSDYSSRLWSHRKIKWPSVCMANISKLRY